MSRYYGKETDEDRRERINDEIAWREAEKARYPVRLAEMHALLQSQPKVNSIKRCPKCLYSDCGYTLVTRMYFEGKWKFDHREAFPGPREEMHPSFDLIERQCPQCRHHWYETPADYTPPE